MEIENQLYKITLANILPKGRKIWQYNILSECCQNILQNVNSIASIKFRDATNDVLFRYGVGDSGANNEKLFIIYEKENNANYSNTQFTNKWLILSNTSYHHIAL